MMTNAKLTPSMKKALLMLDGQIHPVASRSGNAAGLPSDIVPARVARALYKRGLIEAVNPVWNIRLGWGDASIVITETGRKAAAALR